MTNLSQFIKQLQQLEAQGHGELPVLFRHGSSGMCGPLGSAYVTDERDGLGPFEPAAGSYISVYAGS